MSTPDGRSSEAQQPRQLKQRQQQGVTGVVACLCSVALIVVTGLLGPSAAELGYAPPGPSRSFETSPPDLLVALVLAIALLVGAAGVYLSWSAVRKGWHPDPRRLLVIGFLCAVAVAIVPPMGSGDLRMYAGFGQLTAQGFNPYVDNVDELADVGTPDELVFEGAPSHTSNVYGPVAQMVFGMSARVAGPSVRNTVWLFQICALFAFLAVALLLHFASGFRKQPSDSADTRARAALLWTCNPLLLFELVNGAHIDTIAVVFGLAALIVLARSAVGAGILVAMSIAIKVSYGLYAVAIAWALIRSHRKLIGYFVAAALTVLLLSLSARPELANLQLASRWVSVASPWGPLDTALENHASAEIARVVVSIGAILLLLVVARRLDSALPRGTDDARGRAIRTAVLLGSAWLLTSPYAFPWYDALVWAPLVLLPASGVDLVLLARLTIVSVAYLPGGTVLQGFTATARHWVNSGLAPALSLALVVLVIVAGPRLSLRSDSTSRLQSSMANS